MQNIDRGGEVCDIDDSKGSRCITNPDFTDASAYGAHWLPVIRFLAALHLVELKACFTPRQERKRPQVAQGAA